MLQFKVSIEKYPELKSIKKTDMSKKMCEIFDLGYRLKYPEHNLESIHILKKLDDINIQKPNIEALNSAITKLLGITNNSSKKGEMVEGMMEEYINDKYGKYNYEVKRSEPHSGDGWLKIDNRKIMVEVKAYSKTVDLKEIEKMKYDMKFNKINYGIFLSLGSDIQNSKPIDIELFQNENKYYYIVKVSKISSDYKKLDIGFSLIEKLSKLENKNSCLILKDELQNKLEKLLESINKNQNLRENYNNMILEINQKFDSFKNTMTLLFLEQQELIGKIIDEVNSNTINTIEINDSKRLKKYESYKIYPNLLKLLDLMKKKNLNYSVNSDKLLFDKGEIKISQEKISINLKNPLISLNISSKPKDCGSNNINFDLFIKLV